MTEHAQYPPSSMERLIACPASILESSFLPPEPSSPYAQHGTMLHEWVVKEWQLPGVVEKSDLTIEDQQYVLTCIDYINTILVGCSSQTVIDMEVKVDLKSFGIETVWGTVDVRIYDSEAGIIHIIDWKFGQGVPVFVDKNKQIMTYAAAANGFPGIVETVVTHIVQPPLDYEGSETYSSQELIDFVYQIMQPAIENAESDDPTYNPGVSQCRFCRARMKCRKRYDLQMTMAQQVFEAHRKLPHITEKELADALKVAKDYAQYVKQLFIHAQEELMRGRSIAGWKLVRGRSTRSWSDEDIARRWIEDNASLTCVENMFKSKFISPSQAEKLDRTLKKNKSFSKLIDKPPGKIQIVVESDKRKAVSPTLKAEDAFKEFAQED